MKYESLSLAAYDARRPWRSHQWCRYFRRNARELVAIPWQPAAELTLRECATVADSVREFQLGETARGRHLVRAAKAYAEHSGDLDYVTAIRLFIGEEQRHSRELARFLIQEGIPLAQRIWTDAAFRCLRKRAGLELCIAVLITAEIIAKVYYAALRDATGSRSLHRLCDQILHDEAEHVRFQAERLSLIRAERARSLVLLVHALQRILFTATCLVVWRKHGRVLRAGGYRFIQYWQAAHGEFREALAQMTPQRLQSGEPRSTARGMTTASS